MCDVIRILYLIMFYLIYRITDLVLLLVMLVQTILNIFSGEPSISIKRFGKSLGVYLQQISEFLSYASDEKPFPFSDWPAPEVLTIDAPTNEFTASDVIATHSVDAKIQSSSSKDV